MEAPADNPPAQPAELDRQRAVERAGRVDILESELLQEHRSVDADQVERQVARFDRVEIERRGVQDQFAARKGPAPALDANAIRSETRRVGKECVSTGRSRWWPDPYKTKNHISIIITHH